MSNINTGTIQTNYPVAGVNNSTQGFRDNFTAIKSNIDTAGNEITELQSKAIVKSAINGQVLDNNLDNTLVSNALIKGFRGVTNNLGSDLTGIITVDISNAPVHHGTITDNVSLEFARWAPVGTHSSVELQLSIINPIAQITLPATVTLESYNLLENTVGSNAISIPYGVTTVILQFSTIDCGASINVKQLHRGLSTQIQTRTPSAVGFPGDHAGAVCVDTAYLYVAKADYDATIDSKLVSNTFATSNLVKLSDTTSVVANMPIVFTGDTFGGIVANYPYYVKTVNAGNATIQISSTRTAGTAGTALTLTEAAGTMTGTIYIGTSIWTRVPLTAF